MAGVHGKENEGGLSFSRFIQFREQAVKPEAAFGVAVAALNSVAFRGIAVHLPFDFCICMAGLSAAQRGSGQANSKLFAVELVGSGLIDPVGEDGKCTPDPDPDLQGLGVPGSQLLLSGDADYYLTPEGQARWDESARRPRPQYSEEEMAQIIADIESGKIQPFRMPDDPNVTFCIIDYSDGACAAGD